jgi:hypothetical protein
LNRPSIAWLALTAVIAVFLAVYVPLAGHGFISDDFGWVQRSRLHTATDLRPLVPHGNDFFRPAVALSFAINHAMFGNQPLGYGITNVLLAVTCALAIVLLLARLGLPRGAAALGGGLWLFNFHGINMAVLWLSGRTALLLTLFAVAAAILVVRGRYLLALIPLALALLSKEEAVALPFVLGLWMALGPRETASRRDVTLWMVSSVAVLCVDLVARSMVGAMAPATAPDYYRFTLDPLSVGRNISNMPTGPRRFRPSSRCSHGSSSDRRPIRDMPARWTAAVSPAASAGSPRGSRSPSSCPSDRVSMRVCPRSARAWSPARCAGGCGSDRPTPAEQARWS